MEEPLQSNAVVQIILSQIEKCQMNLEKKSVLGTRNGKINTNSPEVWCCFRHPGWFESTPSGRSGPNARRRWRRRGAGRGWSSRRICRCLKIEKLKNFNDAMCCWRFSSSSFLVTAWILLARKSRTNQSSMKYFVKLSKMEWDRVKKSQKSFKKALKY